VHFTCIWGRPHPFFNFNSLHASQSRWSGEPLISGAAETCSLLQFGNCAASFNRVQWSGLDSNGQESMLDTFPYLIQTIFEVRRHG
jgi:hypothetical protein